MDKIIFVSAILSVIISIIVLVISIVILKKTKEIKSDSVDKKLDEQSVKFERGLSLTKQEVNTQIANSVSAFSNSFSDQQRLVFEQQKEKIETLSKTVEASIKLLDTRIEEMRKSVDNSLSEVRRGNEKSLEEIRKSVDEKLQTSIEERITRSFKEVSERLQEVYSGLGEMKNLATGVGDLKKVLSNVKTRGILGEIQLGAILSEILSPEQYDTNVETIPQTGNRVEFAVKLPGEGKDGFVYLPIDSKFPGDAYIALQDAYEIGDFDKVKEQKATLKSRIKSFAKDISTKYIAPPHTTDFAIMFLPTEGLYAEVVQMGLVEELQRSKINIAGPTTMAALLNSLQTGFRTLAIQKRSGEVWEILSAVKTEFEKFEEAIVEAQKKMNQASDGLEKLVGVRTRAINRKLRDVSVIPSDSAIDILEEQNDR